MRFVEKKESDKTAKLKSEETYKLLKDIVVRKNKSEIKETIYRDVYKTVDGNRSRVEDKLSLTYYNKCAYCERICKADIEHYRPKLKVSEDSSHDGYYWLCYEWTNLIPSCITCNRDGGKHNHFPILGTRVFNPPELVNRELDLEKFKANKSPLIDEKPYLLHPEIDNPDLFFEFVLDDNHKGIRIKGIDNEGRGNKTIEICKLNRQEVVLDRKKLIVDDFSDVVRSVFYELSNQSINEEEFSKFLSIIIKGFFAKAKDEKLSHTLLRKFIIKSSENFKSIIIPFLPDKVQDIVLECFNCILSDN
ncbi:MAG: hypothetical protein N4A32_04025 [Marinifilaceae bacterium]|jgi:hypothetical protein|nr:hypothetical protein [Marinifilaceae bacterium]